MPLTHWEILVVGHWEVVQVATGVAYVGVTVGAPLLWVTVTDTHCVVDRVKVGGRVPLMVSDTLPVPLPPSVVVRVPVPRGALPE